jgi:hypothetical protein
MTVTKVGYIYAHNAALLLVNAVLRYGIRFNQRKLLKSTMKYNIALIICYARETYSASEVLMISLSPTLTKKGT